MKNELNEFLRNSRSQFEKHELTEEKMPADPFVLFNEWLKQAIEHKLNEPYAMALATCENNKPSQRIVYVRDLVENGFVFYSNYLSKKGSDINKNEHASVLFFWAEVERQIRIEGTVRHADVALSDAYFKIRPRNSQLGAWASEQSKIIASRNVLDERMKKFDAEFKDKEIERPPHWGGFLFIPTYYEFWQGRPNRLHDRIVYTQHNKAWQKSRVAP